jgi:hypothetical protein
MSSNITVLPTPIPCGLPPFTLNPSGLCSPVGPPRKPQRDLPSEPDRFIGSRQRIHAADLDDTVDAAPSRQPRHFFLPLRMSLVVDAFRSSELTGQSNFFVARSMVLIIERRRTDTNQYLMRPGCGSGLSDKHRPSRLVLPFLTSYTFVFQRAYSARARL